MMLYQCDSPPIEGKPYCYLGVYILKWQQEWGQPTVGFAEVDDQPVLPPAALGALGEEVERLQQACEFAAAAIEDAIYCDDGLDGGAGEAVLATMRDLGASIPQRPRRLWDETLALLAEARGITPAEAMRLVADKALAIDARPAAVSAEALYDMLFDATIAPSPIPIPPDEAPIVRQWLRRLAYYVAGRLASPAGEQK